MAVPVIGGLISIISAGIARLLTIETLKFIATKALIIGAMTLILPVVLYNVFTTLLQEMIDIASTQIGGAGLSSAVVNLTGLAGWIAIQINLASCLSIFLSAVALKWVLGFIRL